MVTVYRVTANSLYLRSTPDKSKAPLAVMPKGAVVVGLEETDAVVGWAKVEWQGSVGYAARNWIELAGGTRVVGSLGPTGSTGSATTAAPNVDVDDRDRDPAKLHPVVRAAVAATVETLNAESFPFRVFEAFRTPERQNHLFAQGRTRPGSIVTHQEAWGSFHQYGLAADLVLFLDSGWSWRSDDQYEAMWLRMKEVAKANGLVTLKFEKPHVQLAGVTTQDLKAGRLPAGGDESWFEAVTGAAGRWTRRGETPPAPPFSTFDRPPLDTTDAQ